MPEAEKRLYKALQSLPDDFVVFHSFKWGKRNSEHKRVSFFENDFLILHKKYGLLIVEVKGGKIYCKDGAIHQVNTYTNEDVALDYGNDPLEQAKRAKYDKFVPLLKKHFNNIFDVFPISLAVSFPMCKKSEVVKLPIAYKDVETAIIYRDDLDNINLTLQRIFNFYFANSKSGVDDSTFSKIIDIIAPTFKMINLGNSFDNFYINYTFEQDSLISYISDKELAAIEGPAGTGKTICALGICENLLISGRKPMYICFNSLLCKNIKRIVSGKNVFVTNIDTLLTNKNLIKNQHITDIVVDEAQDFDISSLKMLYEFSQSIFGSFFVCYDQNQNVNRGDSIEFLSSINPHLNLTYNCRTTDLIAKTSINIIDRDSSLLKSIGNIGEYPTLSFSENVNSIDKLINLYLTKGYQYKDIVILTLSTTEKSQFTNYSNNNFKITPNPTSANEIFITSARKFKGLESKIVIIVDLDNKCFVDEELKQVFYVACSRACNHLSLLVIGNEGFIDSIANSIGYKVKSPTSKGKILIASKTTLLTL